MIAENELRIGNFYIDICGEINKWAIYSYQFYAKHPLSGEDLYKDLKPIPLTPEILLKAEFVGEQFGFENCKYTNGFVSVFFNHQYKSTFFKYYEQGEKKVYRVLEYLHQLQNLYHALTGEELNIEL